MGLICKSVNMFHRYGTNTNEDTAVKLDVARCDHYSYEEDVTDSTPLNNSYKKNGTKNKAPAATKLGGTTKCLLLPIILLTAASLLYSYKLQIQLSSLTTDLSSLNDNVTTLQSTLRDQSVIISSLNTTVNDHSAVISRFKDSVSNSDVLDTLETLKKEWEDSKSMIEKEMNNTKTEIRQVLDSTEKSIDKTVHKAQNEIQSEVNLVQSNLSKVRNLNPIKLCLKWSCAETVTFSFYYSSIFERRRISSRRKIHLWCTN